MPSYRKILLLLGTLTPRKVWNLLLIYFSFYYSRLRNKAIHRGNPVKIGFEPTTHCNLRCPECPSGLRSFTRPTGMLNAEAFQSTVNQLHRDLIYLLLYFQGEPYLHPEFLDMASYARSKGIYTGTSTNGHYLTPEKARQTVKSGISEVIISIDGATQETYQAYRVGGKLSKVIEGVQNLVQARKEARSLSPVILIQFLVVKPNEHEIDDIRRMGKELGVDKVLFKTAQIYDFEKGSDLIPTLDRYSRYRKGADGRYSLKNKLENQCWKLWQGAEITWDGRVLPCCFDKDAQYEMGSLAEKPFAEIWRNPAYEAFRGRLLRSRAEIDICRNCSEGTQVWA
ncbi:MAG: radical SAM protein [Bacteroidetes bacterium]|nr:MAG: radical SAM protein [Bacteroidota bacterium]